MDNEKIYELVLFNIKNGKAGKYNSVYDYYYSKLESYAGFNSIETYKSCTDDHKYFDFGKWDSLEQAKAAVKLIYPDPDFKGFFDLMDESIFFHHGKLIAETFKQAHNSKSDCQLTIYQVLPEKYDSFIEQREILYNILKDKMIGFQGIYTFQSLTDNNWFVDLSYCSDIKKVMEKQNDLNDLPEMKDMLETLGEIKFCNGIERVK